MTSAAYIICATPRSGSTLLCDLLPATGVAGRPASYFRRQSIDDWRHRFGLAAWGADLDQSYLDAVLRAGAGDTGLFGLRLMWESAQELRRRLDAFYPDLADDAARMQQAFGPIRYIHLSRGDKVAQAVSLLKAEQSGLWHAHADGTERERSAPPCAPHYDVDRLAVLVAELEADDAAWRDWFAQHQIAPLSLAYEVLSARPQATLAAVLAALGRDPVLADGVRVATAKLATVES